MYRMDDDDDTACSKSNCIVVDSYEEAVQAVSQFENTSLTKYVSVKRRRHGECYIHLCIFNAHMHGSIVGYGH
jgi:hypothetical protein